MGGGINPRQDVLEKRWTTAGFGRLSELIKEEFGGDIVMVGAESERELCREISRFSRGATLDLCGGLPFKTSAALVKQSKMVVCNDSAIMHVAVAFKVPSVAVFGPSNPRSLLPGNRINRWVSAGLDCSPCYCNSIFPGCSLGLNCMNELKPEIILRAMKELWIDHYQRTQIFRGDTVL